MQNLDQFKYSVAEGMNANMGIIPTYTTLRKFFFGKTCIELGSADGGGTKILLKYFNEVTAIDGSKIMLDKLRKQVRSRRLRVIHSYFENLNLSEKFDTIIMSHILEHVDDPIEVLKISRKFAHKKSRIIIAVPNALSLHRQVGVIMRLLNSEYDLNERDKAQGHQRVYDRNKLETDITKAGLKIITSGGFIIKCFSNDQLEKIIGNSPKAIRAFSVLGEKYPDIAAEIYAICRI